MRILVTGATGFIGRHVVQVARERGHEIRALTTGSRENRFDDRAIDVRQADLSDAATPLAPLLEGVDAVVHAAALMDGTMEQMVAVTLDGTRRLVDAMAAVGITRGVLISTFAIYDYERIPENASLDEDAPLVTSFERRHPYLVTKAKQEQVVGGWTILRPGIVFGLERGWHYHLGNAKSETRWTCLSPDAILPIVSVTSCADAIALAAERADGCRQILNLVDDALPTRLDYMKTLASHQTPPPAIKTMSWSTLKRMAALASFANTLMLGKAPLPDLLRKASLHARCKPLRYSNARARAALDWVPSTDYRPHLK